MIPKLHLAVHRRVTTMEKSTSEHIKKDMTSFERPHLIQQRAELNKFVKRAKGKAKEQYKFKQLWKLVTSPFNLMLSYAQIHKNRGALTSGVDSLTPNGVGVEYLQTLRTELVEGTYKHEAVRRIYVPKPGSQKKRPLGIPTFRDRIVQAAVKNVLEAIFEPTFEHVEKEQNEIARNFGFRPRQRPQEAILKLSAALSRHVNVIELDIKGAFDNVSHRKVIEQVQTRVQDRRLLNLIRQMLKAGIMYMDKEETPFKGTPQGSIVSPLLWNICFELFDNFVRTELSAYMEEINTKEKRNARSQRSPAYSRICTKVQTSKKRLDRYRNAGMHRTDETYKEELRAFKALKLEQMNTKSIIQHNVSKIKSFRFADDVVLLHDGMDREIPIIKAKTFEFLRTLGLEASEEKTQIKKSNDVRNPVKFLGFELARIGTRTKRRSTPSTTRTLKLTNALGVKELQTIEVKGHRNKERTAPGQSVRPNQTRILARLHNRGYCDKSGWPIHSKLLFLKSDFEIVSHYNLVLRGILQYYATVVTDRRILQRIGYILRYSCAKTLANKHKSSISKIFKKITRRMKVQVEKQVTNTRTGESKIQTFRTSIPNTTDLIRDSFRAWFNKEEKEGYNPYEVSVNMRTIMKLTDRCTVCGTTHDQCPIEHHHTNSCKSIRSAGWRRFVQMLERKVIPICKDCHDKAGRGELNNIKFSDLNYPEAL